MQYTEKYRPKVGVGVIVIKKDKVLLGKRKNSLGEGTWSVPGGRLEMWEELWQCAEREVREETDLKIGLIDKNPVAITNDMFYNEKEHYVILFIRANYIDGKPKVMEPDKCESWEWFEWDNLPSPLSLPIENLIKQGYNPFRLVVRYCL